MSRNGFVLGVDVDGVCADYERGLRRFLSAERGVDPESLPPAAHWSLVDSGWFDTEPEYSSAHDRAVQAGMFAHLPVITDAAQTLSKLSDDGVRIRIITHRLLRPGFHRRVVADTVGWLEDSHIPFWDLCFVSDKTTVGCDLLIDDGPHNLLALSAAGRPVLIFDHLYNRHVPGPRVHSWAEVPAQVQNFREGVA